MIGIKKVDGCELLYDEHSGRFCGRIAGETVIQAATQKEVEEYLKKALKKGFKRIPAIRSYIGRAILGEITSLVKEPSSSYYVEDRFSVWFCWQAADGPRREKVLLRSEIFYPTTPVNNDILARVQELQSQSDAINTQIESALKELSEPITNDNILEQGR